MNYKFENDSLLRQISPLEKQVEKEKKETDKVKEENDGLKKQISFLNEEMKSIRTEKVTLKEENASLKEREASAVDSLQCERTAMFALKKQKKSEEEMFETEKNLLNEEIAALKKEISSLKKAQIPYDIYKEKQHKDIEKIFSDRQTAFPYVAAIANEYLTIDLKRLEEIAQHGTYYQRKEQSIKIRELRAQTKEFLEEYKVYEYQLKYLIDCYPALQDLLDSNDEPDADFSYKDIDPIRKYLSKEEYDSLSECARNQLALDRYVESRKKSNWQIGRDYELSVGYQFEKEGNKVIYFGSTEGLSDLGRDIIVLNEAKKTAIIIQCKYWSAEKVIHEKHINQLFGTGTCYSIDHPEYKVSMLFVTNITLSPTAKAFAEKLNVQYRELMPLREFPRIKCNIGRDEYGLSTKIYHLPMDQQYDNVVIKDKGECWAYTTKEAEDKGFRRAYRWHGDS